MSSIPGTPLSDSARPNLPEKYLIHPFAIHRKHPVARPAHFLLPPGEEPLASLPLLFPVQAVPADNLPPVVLLPD
ncbi:TPA: hypothetical protein LND99_003029 [Enterococcus faecium]|nr:hypothetical protein [Enterococcus faecium]HBK6847651.1 hypothetical protein [Enterococcus faecium]